MTRYIIKRLLQGIPLIFIISIILFVLMMNMGDPIATMGGRSITRPSDRIRLTRQLGLDKPIYMQYIYWLIGNDWTKVDLDGDSVAETSGTRRGILRGDFGTSLVNRGKPVTKVIGERLPNTIMLMVALGNHCDFRSAGCRGLFGYKTVFMVRSYDNRIVVHWIFDADIFYRLTIDVYICGVVQTLGFTLFTNRRNVRSKSWKNYWTNFSSYDFTGV
jgi:peptide/nickel transport system permease protein